MPPKANPTPTGLGEDVVVPKLVPALQPQDLMGGCVTRWIGTEERQSSRFGNKQQLHHFELGPSQGKRRFCMWGAAMLDQKIKQVQRNSIIVLQYEGKQESGDRSQHVWTVRPFRGNVEQLAELSAAYAVGTAAVSQAIDYMEQAGTFTAGPKVDDDLPF